ncbi:MAG: PAS domain S-box protein [Phycisphaerae bacterium]
MVESTKQQHVSRLLIVVEDDASQRRTITEIMEAEGFEVIGCGTAAEALKYVENGRFGVAIVDLSLPDLPGVELLQEIRAISDHIRVIIHTGNGSFDSAKVAVNLGAFAYVEKLSDPAELIGHVHRAYREHLHCYASNLEAQVAQRIASLRESEARGRAIVETAADGIITIDERGIIESFNKAAEQIFGYTADEVIGKNVNVLIPSPDKERHDEYIARYLRTGEAKIIGSGREAEGRRMDGTIFPMHLAVSEVRLAERRIFTGIVRDITERKQAEEALLRAKEAAEAANQAKSEFLANMSHEIRTPLHGILSFARFGVDKALTADSQKLLNYFQKIDISAKRLMALLSDLLDLAKIEAGKMRFEFKPADLRTVLRSVENEFRSLLARRNITIDYSEPANEVRLTLDQNRMMQVVRNLLSNAAKFSPEGGTIRMNVNTHDEGVEISIRDHGVGIPEEELETIFGKFVQSSKTKSGAGGTGLGLSICR